MSTKMFQVFLLHLLYIFILKKTHFIFFNFRLYFYSLIVLGCNEIIIFHMNVSLEIQYKRDGEREREIELECCFIEIVCKNH